MALKPLKIKLTSAVLLAAFIFSEGCNNNTQEPVAEEPTVDTTKTTDILKLNGEIFSIPSPVQTAFLIKKTGANFDKKMLNEPKKVDSYSTNFKKAVNLGAYGADLGYVTLYDQTQEAMVYMATVKKLGDNLGISGAFDMSLVKRFQDNMGKKDSMLVLVSSAYRSSDTYLKNNKRSDVSGLVLAGGWIETLYFIANVNAARSNDEIIRRIGEQKSSLQSLIKILTPYADQAEYADLISRLTDLSTVFDGINFKYTYQKPTVDVEKKLTTINSTTDVIISPEQIESISKKIKAIRTQIVG